MFGGEELASQVRILEDAPWVDHLVILEANRTFKNRHRPFALHIPRGANHARQVRFDARKKFRSGVWNRKAGPWWLNRSNCHWYNERVLRDSALNHVSEIQDDDIVVVSDLDEIVDRRAADRLVDEATRHGIVTCWLRLTHYYANLYVDGWPGPPHYSYRLFAMTGRHLRRLPVTLDDLRKSGERGDLIGTVHEIPEFLGFHHSWLGPPGAAVAKLGAYAHAPADHADQVVRLGGRSISPEEVRRTVANRRPLFDGIQLRRDDGVAPLQAFSELRPEIAASAFC